DTDTDTDTDVDLLPLDVTGVDPAHGSDAGGANVQIDGGPFDGSAQVFFGDERATVRSFTSTTVTVDTPANDVGLAHVKVVTDTHQGEANNAYRYWPDGSGSIGIFGSFSHTRYLGEYWCLREPCTGANVGTPEPLSSAAVTFIEPGELEWWQVWAPSLRSCRSNYEASLTATIYDPEISRFFLRRGDSSPAITLFPGTGDVSATTFVTSGNVATSYANNANWELESEGGNEWPAFKIAGAIQTPGTFSITSPVVSSSTIPTVRRNTFNVAWNGSGGDYVIIRALRYSNGSFVEEVSCAVNDSGAFTIPSSSFSGWSSGGQITLLVGRVIEPNGVVPFNNSRSGLAGVQWVVGAARTE
ncbi:MAG: IPT/TIG domain-containing protein, partial [Myxococcota bacterium]